MKKTLFFLSLLTSLYSAQTVELSGDMNYPPYSYVENGTPKGVYVDIIKTAFKRIKEYDVKFNMMAYKRAIAMVKQGKTVGFFPPYYGIDRTRWTKFSEPILAETTIVFAKENILKDRTTYPEDFYGKTLCLNRGFNKSLLGGDKLASDIENKNIKLIEANNNQACLSRVSRGLADFYINDQLIDTSKFPNIKKGMNVKGNFGHVGFTLKKKNYKYIDDLELKFNQAIKDLKNDGTIDKILLKYKGD